MRNWILALGLLTAACATVKEDAVLPVVRVQPAAVAGIPPGTGFPAASGEESLVVRAVSTRDIPGARCMARTTIYTAEFVAPARLVVPTFGRQSPEVRVDCVSGGLRGAALVQPFYRRTNGFGGWPAVGIGIDSRGGVGVNVGGWWNGGWGVNNPQAVIVRYPSVDVPMR